MSKSEPAHEAAQQATPGAPPTLRPRDVMLLDFVHQCDADPPACPVCRYSLRGLTRPVCPECGKELLLMVGAAKHPIGWLLTALAPGFFSGIAAVFVLIPIFGRFFIGDGVLMGIPIALDAFGWSSGIFAIFLARKRARFLALSLTRQRWFALTIWIIHIAALGLFILLGVLFS